MCSVSLMPNNNHLRSILLSDGHIDAPMRRIDPMQLTLGLQFLFSQCTEWDTGKFHYRRNKGSVSGWALVYADRIFQDLSFQLIHPFLDFILPAVFVQVYVNLHPRPNFCPSSIPNWVRPKCFPKEDRSFCIGKRYVENFSHNPYFQILIIRMKQSNMSESQVDIG